ncbi:MAG TPA: RICIN domain-containing protein, partial [Acidimicrobiales bacterium]|nr:RICIN domain-containing protein [Acidimicrobiales bacterium]
MSVATVAGGLSAIEVTGWGAPAAAAPIYAPTNPGTNLVASIEVPYSASAVSTFSSQIAAPWFGLGAGASPTAVATATANYVRSVGPPPASVTDGATPTPSWAGIEDIVAPTMSVTIGSDGTATATVTVTVPQSTVAGARADIAGIIGFSAGETAMYTAFLICGLFVGRGLPTTPPPDMNLFQQFNINRHGSLVMCQTFAYAIAQITSYSINDRFLGANLHSAIWGGIVAFAALTGIGGLLQNYLVGYAVTYAGLFATFVTQYFSGLFASISNWFSGGGTAIVGQVLTDLEGALLPDGVEVPVTETLSESVLNLIAVVFAEALEKQVAGIPTADAAYSGTIFDPFFVPPYPANASCADGGYGNAQPLTPGEIVAFNACNANPNQDWTAFGYGTPTVQFEDDGYCLAPADESVATSQPLIIQWCDGSATQNWVVQPSGDFDYIWNLATGLYLTVPSSPSYGTQLIDNTFIGGANTTQIWLP